MKDKMAIL